MPPERLDERGELDRRLEHADVAGAAEERLGPFGDESDQVRALQQKRREQEALDADLDPPRDAEAAEVDVGERDGLPAAAHRVDEVAERGVALHRHALADLRIALP